MRYLCLVCFEGSKLMELIQGGGGDALTRESLAYNEELRRGGHLVAAEALQPPDTAVTVRVRSGKLSTTDGPFVETKEQVGGAVLIEARDLNEAIRLAAGIPLARLGAIEVRPVMDLSGGAPSTGSRP